MENANKFIEAVLRHDFNSFIHKAFNTVNPGAKFAQNWHINLIAEYLEAVRSGKIKRLIINMPPRGLKSVCVNVAWPAWLLGHNPALRIISVSYSQILSIKHSLDCRMVIESPWYKKIFPRAVLNKYHNQKSKFLTSLNGFRFASSIGGSITGEGGDYLIIDDPHNPLHINSDLRRGKVIEWFEQVFFSRLNDKAKGAIVLVMQRLHNQDLSGYLLAEHKNWQVLKIPMYTDKILEFKINEYAYTFLPGYPLNQKKDALPEISEIRKTIGEDNFKAQYLQEPILNNYSLLKIENISFYDVLPDSFEYFIQSWDTAINISLDSDYSVGTCFGIIDKKYYLVAAFREKVTYPFLKKEVDKLSKLYNPRYILIENQASGQQLIQDLKAESKINIIACKPKFNKIIRFSAVLNDFHLGKILFPKFGPLKSLILSELIHFPHSKNDDIVDSISQFLIFMQGNDDIKVTPRIRAL